MFLSDGTSFLIDVIPFAILDVLALSFVYLPTYILAFFSRF